ncbi:MAG TPA: YdcF family protein [Chitinophagales bacterium]|nr:YdcF family protein [Chitinophagales bacterium]
MHSKLGMLLLLAVSGVFSSCSLLDHHTMATYHKHVVHAPFDVVIVPGLPHDTNRLNPLLKARMLWAKELYENGTARHIIFSGSAVHTPFIEGMVMKIMADSIGIPTQHTFIEDKAHHSNENVAFGISKAISMGFKKIAIATDPIQSIYIKKYIRDNHVDLAILPFSVKAMPVYYNAVFPKVKADAAFVQNFVPLKQRDIEPKDRD